MSNQPQRRGSGLITPPGVPQGMDPELLAAIQGAQPTKEEQARIAGVQIAMQFNEQRDAGSRHVSVKQLTDDAEAIALYLRTGPSATEAPDE